MVRAKNGISTLWRDVDKEPYTTVFDPSKVTADAVVKAVDFLRLIGDFLRQQEASDAVLESASGGRSLKIEQVAKHGNRLFAHFVMREFDVFDSTKDVNVFHSQVSLIDLEEQFGYFCQTVHQEYPDSYVARLFKNQEKCAQLSKAFLTLKGAS